MALVLLAGLAGCGEGGPGARDREPLALLDGRRLAPADLRGRWLLVNYWAEWCRPCLAEIPELNQFHASRDDAVVLGVNFDRVAPEAAREQAEKLGIEFPVIAGSAPEWLPVEPPEVLPSTYVIDPAGRLATTLHGPQTERSLQRAIAGGVPQSEGSQ